MPQVVYNRGKFRIMTGATVLGGGTPSDLRMVLITGASLPAGWNNPDLNTLADLAAVTDVVLHTGDVFTLTGEAVTQNDTDDRADADSGNATFAAAASTTARAAVIYHEVTAADTDRFLITGHSDNFPQPMDGGLTVNIADYLRGQTPA